MYVCDEVDLYGFGVDSKGNWYYYWENNLFVGVFCKMGVYDVDFEFNVMVILVFINKIWIFKGR